MMRGRDLCLLVAFVCLRASASEVRMVLQDKIPVGRAPYNLTITPNKSEIYVTNHGDNSVSVISWPGKKVSMLQVCDEPWVIAAAPDGSAIFAGCRGAVAVISTRTKQVNLVKCCGWVWDLAITRDGRTVYIAGQRSGLFRMDTKTLRVEMVNSTQAAMKLALTPSGKFLYVNYQSSGPGGRPGHDAIAQYDTSSGRLVRTILDLPNVGGSLAVSADGSALWANGTDACLSTRYDHQGCPIVPATIVNVLRLPAHVLLGQITRQEPVVRQAISFSPAGRFVVISGQNPTLHDSLTLRLLATATGFNTVDWLFPGDSDFVGLATLHDENKVAVFSIVND